MYIQLVVKQMHQRQSCPFCNACLNANLGVNSIDTGRTIIVRNVDVEGSDRRIQCCLGCTAVLLGAEDAVLTERSHFVKQSFENNGTLYIGTTSSIVTNAPTRMNPAACFQERVSIPCCSLCGARMRISLDGTFNLERKGVATLRIGGFHTVEHVFSCCLGCKIAFLGIPGCDPGNRLARIEGFLENSRFNYESFEVRVDIRYVASNGFTNASPSSLLPSISSFKISNAPSTPQGGITYVESPVSPPRVVYVDVMPYCERGGCMNRIRQGNIKYCSSCGSSGV